MLLPGTLPDMRAVNTLWLGGATITGVGELNEYVTPRFAKAGDKLIITKWPAIEASGIFA